MQLSLPLRKTMLLLAVILSTIDFGWSIVVNDTIIRIDSALGAGRKLSGQWSLYSLALVNP